MPHTHSRDNEVLEKVKKSMVESIPGLVASHKEKRRAFRMSFLLRRREKGDLIQTWCILNKKDCLDLVI